MLEFKPIPNFGFKVVDRSRADVEPIMQCALAHHMLFEVGLYHQDPATHDMLRAELRDSALAVNTHLDHHRLSIFDLQGQEAYLRQQIETSLEIGAGYAIDHIGKALMSPRRSHRKALSNQQRVSEVIARLSTNQATTV